MADGFADRVMQKLSGGDEPDGDEAPDPAGDAGESDGDVAIAAVNKNDGAAFEAAVKRICGYGK